MFSALTNFIKKAFSRAEVVEPKKKKSYYKKRIRKPIEERNISNRKILRSEYSRIKELRSTHTQDEIAEMYGVSGEV